MNAETEHLAELLDAWLDGDAVAAPPGELSELLAAAEQVRLLTDVPAPPGGLSRGRAAFITAGVAQANEAAPGGFMAAFTALLGRYRMAPMTLMVALLLLGGVVTTARAQSSLPGDLLYPVKRLTESVQVVIARGDDRESMRAELQRRRRDETQLLLARHRAAPVAFEGQAELGDDGVWRVGGVAVRFAGPLPDGLGTGALVALTGVTDADGVVRVTVVRVLTVAAASPAPAETEPAATPMAAVAMLQDEPTPTSHPVTPTPVPVIATRLPSPTTEPPTVAPTGIPTSLAPADPVREKQYVEWDGSLERSNGDWWIVAGREFYRPSGRARGDVVTCALVHVRAQLKKDGKLYLDELVVTAPAPKPAREEPKGTITALGADFIDIDGQRIILPRNVVVVGKLEIGRFARLVLRVECGRRIAEHIEVDGPKPIQFTGILRSFDSAVWVVDDRSLQVVVGTTQIDGTPWVGARVDVWAVEGDGDTLLALRLVVNGAPPTATDATMPTATSTAEPPSPTPGDTPTVASTSVPGGN